MLKGDYRHLARIFSADAFRGLSTPAGPAEVRGIVTESGVAGLARKMRLRALFDRAFEVLLQSYRFDYVYRAALTNQIFLARHGGCAAAARLLTEFWVGEVRADLAVIDDTSTVYEIKTDFDSFARLSAQLAGYSRLFDRIFVVTSSVLRERLLRVIPERVGVLVLDAGGQLVEARPAASNLDQVDTRVICRAMREMEVLEICRRRTGQRLDMANMLRVQACWEIFGDLSPLEAHREMVGTIRTRKIHPAQIDLVERAPASLKHLALAKTMNVGQFRAILPRLDLVA